MCVREQCHLLLDELSDNALNELIELINEIKLADSDEDMEYCISLYDEAVSNDDCSRIDSESLKAKD